MEWIGLVFILSCNLLCFPEFLLTKAINLVTLSILHSRSSWNMYIYMNISLRKILKIMTFLKSDIIRRAVYFTYIHLRFIEVSKSQSDNIYEVVNIKRTVLGAIDIGLILLDFVTIYPRLRNEGFVP